MATHGSQPRPDHPTAASETSDRTAGGRRTPPATSGDVPQRMVVGRVVRPHGLRGEVTVEVLSDAPDRFTPGARLAATPPDQAPDRDAAPAGPDPSGRPAGDRRPHTGADPSGPLQELTVAAVRHQQGRLLVRFAELDGRDRVERLRGHLLTIPAAAARPLDDGEYWPHQLTGLTVTDPDGTVRGTVSDVVAGAAHDLLQVQLTTGRSVLVPCVAALIGVDLDAGRITVQPLAGLLE